MRALAVFPCSEKEDKCCSSICRVCGCRKLREYRLGLMASNCSLKLIIFWDESLRQRRTWLGPLGLEIKFGRAAMGSGRGSWWAECRIAEWFWELGNHKFVVAPVHTIAVFSLADFSSPVMRTLKMLIETEAGGAVDPGQYKTAIKFCDF